VQQVFLDRLKIAAWRFSVYYWSLRYSSYRMFVSWSHGHLGKGIRRVIPSCVVRTIRESYPEADGQYTGFRVTEDGEEILDSEVYI
jgi:hypothetical protein